MAIDLWNLYTIRYANELKTLSKDLDKCSQSALISRLKKCYLIVKRACVDLYQEDIDSMHDSYLFVLKDLYNIEKTLNNKYVMDTRAHFKYGLGTLRPTSNNPYDLVRWILQNVRDDLNYKVSGVEDVEDIEDFNKLDLSDYCSYASEKVELYARIIDAKNYVIKIVPGFNEDYRLFYGSEYHFVNIVKIKDKCFLIDPTYKQFFSYRENLIERTGIMGITNCNLGRYVLMDKKRRDIATKLFQDGWIEINPEVFKTYLDGFAIRTRNQLYYDKTGDYSYTTPYSAKDYIRFLSCEDDQIKHEGIDVLGFLKEPIRKR